jgi:hypothetical protein
VSSTTGPATLSERELYARALRAKRGRALLKEQDDQAPSGWGEVFSWVFMGWFMVADGWFLADRLGWAPGLLWLLSVAIVVAGGVALAAITKPALAALIFALAFGISGLLQLGQDGASAVFSTHGISGLAVAALVTGSRARGLARHVPLLLPLIIVVLFVPLFTADLWRAADDFGWRELIVLSALVLLPLLVAVYRRMSASLQRTLANATNRIAAADNHEQRVVQLVRSVGSEERDALDANRDRLSQRLDRAFDRIDMARVGQEVGDEIRPRLRRLLRWRLATTVAGIAALVGSYTYLLAWTAVTARTAAVYVGHPVHMHHLDLVGDIPAAPFVHVAALFGLLATAVFLAFALTEDDYTDALTDSLVARPFEEILLLVIPYRAAAGYS